MSWIKVIGYEEANKELKRIYDRVKGPNNNVDNVLLIHSLRPHTLVGHMALYKNVLHNSNNTLPKWYLEALGTYVSHLNQCDYCFEHHFEGFKRLLGDDSRADTFKEAVLGNTLSDFFSTKFFAGSQYAKKLTLDHTNIIKEDIEGLREVGFTEGEILEVNQVVSYFNYVNRSVVGLGVDTQGDILGLSPNDSDDPNNWSHN
ncbi:carboxymuconolactone decarboxylase family protein [Flagellimonas myxillae]|uniref:carboxymuconolactone decarboxylase family protein n=1 Tax=Flagellimonas myxillae TaxID=2942214 RepID=UPI00201F384D|nr:peroxidase-related enzyme [Muricauda myxillae]MCL6266179.1 peroxidase-related enzyme [Muricauda myxillae]